MENPPSLTVPDLSSVLPLPPSDFIYPGGRSEISTQIILIHGGWQGPEVFCRIIPGLERAGYSVVAPSLPSAGLPVALDEDVKIVENAIRSSIEIGKDVVLVMHSYGAVPGCEALKGFKDREVEDSAKGFGKILKLVFISALVLPVGTSIYPNHKGNGDRAGFEYKDGLIKVTDATIRFFNDLCSREANYWAQRLRQHSRSALASNLTYPAYKYYPSSYLVCSLDNSIPLWVQKKMAFAAAIKEVEQVETGHFPQLSQPGAVRKFIRRSAGESFPSL